MSLFLSYCHEDEAEADRIAAELTKRRFEVYRWQDPQHRGERFLSRIEQEISRADCFLALLSPSYLTSLWCRRESQMAIHREIDLQATDGDSRFVYVLEVRQVSRREVGFLGQYDLFDMRSSEGMSSLLAALGERPPSPHGGGNGRVDSLAIDEQPVFFRNRHDELEKLWQNITNCAGEHFWCIVSPPQLGKTWLLNQLCSKFAGVTANDREDGDQTPRATARVLDIRQQPPEVRSDPRALLRVLFPHQGSHDGGRVSRRRIAQTILSGRRPFVCVLDGAELLDRETARALRERFGEIHHLVERAGQRDSRLVVLVAGRRGDGWQGVVPKPRYTQLRLTEFTAQVVHMALRDLAKEMDHLFPPNELEAMAGKAHQLSEGLPGILTKCLRWLRRERWVRCDDLGSEELFATLVRPYVRESLLSANSLACEDHEEDAEPLEHALRVLCPYRLFTQAHLTHHLSHDRSLRGAVTRRGWSGDDLWRAVSEIALLQPTDEPWQELYPTVRRLLFRHFYTTSEQRALAHRQARGFVEMWMGDQTGTDLLAGIAACLWHEAAATSLDPPGGGGLGDALPELVRGYRAQLRSSVTYSEAELCEALAGRLSADQEFEEVVGSSPGLFDRLLEMIRTGSAT